MKKIIVILFLSINGLFAQNNATTNPVYSDWLTFKNPYDAMQVRYQLEKQEGDIGYFKTQFRINYEEPTRCTDPRCLGYALCFGYPILDEKEITYLHYKFYYPYNEIYTVPGLIPIKMSFPDGSKRMLRKDGFYYTVKDNTEEIDLQYYFIKSTSSILEGYPIKFNNFIESKAIILK